MLAFSSPCIIENLIFIIKLLSQSKIFFKGLIAPYTEDNIIPDFGLIRIDNPEVFFSLLAT